ncbi:GNAT family N-acetyltransferase [Coxiella-like endosymbiont]|uniref:GNAT family N-acetyltransferase n=1 Tax=Coxiella-like endosymbiont TaxID=1592897 RepID=UPI00272C4946|nr:GNAT family N-acetyltransferase [Coxiella-like endosymbiont]
MIHIFYNEGFPILDIDENFFLREQIVKDLEAFFEYYTNPEVTRYILASNPRNLVKATAEIHYCRDLFKYKHAIYWTLARNEDDYMIDSAIGLYINNQHYRTEICYDLSRHYWNRGIVKKALRKVIEFCFKKTAVHRIEAISLKENMISIATFKKTGFSWEGPMKKYRYFNGRSHDIEIFPIISENESP